jgi:hypothetical protein
MMLSCLIPLVLEGTLSFFFQKKKRKKEKKTLKQVFEIYEIKACPVMETILMCGLV